VKRKKAQEEKPTVGIAIAAKYRKHCNELTDAEREKCNEKFLKLY